MNVRVEEFNHLPLTNPLRRRKRRAISFNYLTEWIYFICMNSV